jgi:2-alkyl-3-oxoalkanoate reductase
VPRIIDAARKGRLKRIGTKNVKVDVTYIDNAAQSQLDAADRLDIGTRPAGKAYFISNGEPVELWPFVDRILKEAGAPPVTKQVSAWKARLAGRVMEWVYRFVPFVPGEPPMTRFVARQMSTSHWYDISAARRDLDYSPKVSVEEGLKRLGERLRAA